MSRLVDENMTRHALNVAKRYEATIRIEMPYGHVAGKIDLDNSGETVILSTPAFYFAIPSGRLRLSRMPASTDTGYDICFEYLAY